MIKNFLGLIFHEKIKRVGEKIKRVLSHKHLGLIFNEKLNWEDHITSACNKSMKRVGILKRLSRQLPRKAKETIYSTFIRPTLEYSDVIFDGCTKKLSKALEQVQRQAALACTGAYMGTHHPSLLQELGWDTLSTRRECHKLTYMYKITNGLAPNYLQLLCSGRVRDRTNYNLRNPNNLVVPYARTVSFARSFIPATTRLWNNLDHNVRDAPSLASFKSRLKRLRCRSKTRLYSQFNGYGPTNQSRMRMGLSGLNFHRHRVGFIPSSHCPNCTASREDPAHFFLLCPRYAAQREVLLRGVAPVLTPGIDFHLLIPDTNTGRTDLTNSLLFGSPILPHQDNSTIFELVNDYIMHTRRF